MNCFNPQLIITLRECVEGLQLLRRPEERKRRLKDIPEIHVDPKMDPNFKSEDNDCEIDSNKQGLLLTYPSII